MSIEERKSKALDLITRMAADMEPDHEGDVLIAADENGKNELWEEILALSKGEK